VEMGRGLGAVGGGEWREGGTGAKGGREWGWEEGVREGRGWVGDGGIGLRGVGGGVRAGK